MNGNILWNEAHAKLDYDDDDDDDDFNDVR